MLHTFPAQVSGLLPYPADFSANVTFSWWVSIISVLTVVPICIAMAIVLTRRVKSPLFLMICVSGALCTVLVEPMLDIVGATYYPHNSPFILFTLLGRPIPLYVLTGYVVWWALTWYAAYEAMRRGAQLKTLYAVMAAAALWDAATEMVATQNGVFTYYGNPTLILGIPLSSIAQNGGLAIVGGFVLLVTVPHLHGWRWILFIPVIPMTYIAYAFACTMPAYLAIHSQAPKPVFWILALVATALNVGVPVVLAKSPIVARYRDQHHALSVDNSRALQPS